MSPFLGERRSGHCQPAPASRRSTTQLEGIRLLVTPFPQQQLNSTDDRRSLQPHLGVACFDFHANRHTIAATHTVGDIRPNEHRHRISAVERRDCLRFRRPWNWSQT